MTSAPKRLVAILGIDTVREKSLHQTRLLAQHSFRTHILTYHRDQGSITHDPSTEIEEIAPRLAGRIRQAFSFLRARRREFHHVELYPAGRFAWAYAVLCRALGIKLVVVERGDIRYYVQRLHSLPTRLSMYACYRLAHRIWYKEPHMADALERLRLRRVFFLPNAIPMPAGDGVETEEGGRRSTDFLWVNRLVPERHPDWFARAVVELSRDAPVKVDVLGFSATRPFSDFRSLEDDVRQTLADLPGVRCLDFTDPEPYYRDARFFVLPADVVFGNFSLLEAMARGVVPIVSDVDGSDLIVEDGENGIVVEHGPEALHAAMERAQAMEPERWKARSRAARATVADRYSLDSWGEQLLREYAELR